MPSTTATAQSASTYRDRVNPTQVDSVRSDLRGYVLEHLDAPDGVWVVDLCRVWNYAESGAGDAMCAGVVGFWPWPAARRSA